MDTKVEMIEDNLTGFMNVQQGLKAPKDINNEYGGFNYRNAEAILIAVKPLLLANKAILITDEELITSMNHPAIKSTATYIDKDGRFSASGHAGIDVNKKKMDYAQCYGASSSYAKKYALCNLFGIDDSKDDPDSKDIEKVIKNENEIKQFFLKSYKPAFNDLTVNFNGQDRTLLHINQNIEKAPLDIVEMAIELIKFQGN